eukprot:4332618-Alexandrium_andersonii.AAC.1
MCIRDRCGARLRTVWPVGFAVSAAPSGWISGLTSSLCPDTKVTGNAFRPMNIGTCNMASGARNLNCAVPKATPKFHPR